ncbi:Glu/Leu/Phe/Val family dehydrogenase [Austwickia chelonae]|uniref:Glu/Leu/Phe/Val family dehydrogenase n=1 Tax=Austwickia chelonae TaxID=100225 RepID=UPI001F087B53|nr:Glu/Leu/Phe/Val dehydrogenase dimerization domain-containing protein [Austwickia chelonae]
MNPKVTGEDDTRRLLPHPERNEEPVATADLFTSADEWGPEKIVYVSDRRTGMQGVLVIDNTARGMGKGGTRMSPTLTVDETARLARTMTWKWAAADLFYGGAKAGIRADPTQPNKEAVLRAFARALADEVPAEYVFGLDMGLDERDAAVLVDELRDRGAATGLPRALGGTPYDQLGITGHGVAEATAAAAEHLGFDLRGARVVVQGFGAVGAAAAHRLHAAGALVIAVSNAHGTVTDPDGLDIEQLVQARENYGEQGLLDSGYTVGGVDDALDIPCDILIPAAKQDVIDETLSARLATRLIVEGANLPTSDSARRILHDRGITVVPDFIANAGGIIAAAYSMDARRSAFVVDTGQVLATVADTLRANTLVVLEQSRKTGLHTRDAALHLAQERVREAMALRGQHVCTPQEMLARTGTGPRGDTP